MPQCDPLQLRFCPYEDVLGVGHAAGFTSLIVPGAGEPTFDTSEVDPYEGKTRRREREVHSLLDKLQPDMITLDPDVLGQLDTRASRSTGVGGKEPSGGVVTRAADGTPYARLSRAQRLQLDGGVEEDADAELDDEPERVAKASRGVVREKNRARGRNSAMKRYLRKKRQNVVDSNTNALREKYQREKERRRQMNSRQMPEESAREKSALDMFAATKGPRK